MITLDFPFRLISKDNEKIANRQGRFFLSRKYRDFEDKVRLYAKQQYIGKELDCPLEMGIIANYTNKAHPDLFNLPKSVCDALQGIIYKNDRQIKHGSISVIEDAKEDSFCLTIIPLGL